MNIASTVHTAHAPCRRVWEQGKVDDKPEFLEAEVLNPDMIRVTEKTPSESKEWKYLTLIPPRGGIITVNAPIQ